MRRASFALAVVVVLLGPVAPRLVCAEEPSRAAEEIVQARGEIGVTLDRMGGRAHRVRDMLRTARRHSPAAVITCLDESLSRSDVALRNARALGSQSIDAYARGDLEEARSSRHRMVEQEIAQLAAERAAWSCKPLAVGQKPKPEPSKTTVRVEVDPHIAPGS